MTQILIFKILRDIRMSLLVVWLLLFVFSVLWVKVAQRVTSEIAPFFNSVAKLSNVNPKLFEEVLFKGPGRVSQSVLGGADVRFDRPSDFLAVEMLHPVVLILAVSWALGRSAGAIAGEVDRGTMELLLSQPIPRSRLILAHFLVDLLVLPLLAFSIPVGTQVGLALVGPFRIDYTVLQKLPLPPAGKAFITEGGADVLEVSTSGQPAAALHLIAFMFAVSGLTMAFSSAGRSRWRVMGYAVLLFVLMFVINVLSQLWDTIAVLRPLSIFCYYQPQKVWLKGDWVLQPLESWGIDASIPPVLVMLGLGALGYLVAWRIFSRRDLPAPL